MHRSVMRPRALCAALLGVAVSAIAAPATPDQPSAAVPNPGVLRGYPQGKFEPNRPVTRQELAIIIARTQRALQSDPNAVPSPLPPTKPVDAPTAAATRLVLAVQIARLLRAVESNPNAAQRPKPPQLNVKPASVPARIPKWARAEVAYLVARGFPVALPGIYTDLDRPATQQDVAAALTWALSSLASRGYIPPGDLAPPPPEPTPAL